jgi:hypothetical protein
MMALTIDDPGRSTGLTDGPPDRTHRTYQSRSLATIPNCTRLELPVHIGTGTVLSLGSSLDPTTLGPPRLAGITQMT